MGIHLSKKHGVNPSIEICAVCGKGIGVALLGRLKNDAEAPREVCQCLTWLINFPKPPERLTSRVSTIRCSLRNQPPL